MTLPIQYKCVFKLFYPFGGNSDATYEWAKKQIPKNERYSSGAERKTSGVIVIYIGGL